MSNFKKLRGAGAPKPSRAVLRNYSGGAFGHIGISELRVKIHGIEANPNLFIVKKASQVLLGLGACESFGLINHVHIVTGANDHARKIAETFPRLFDGLGCTKKEYKMVLKDGIRPVIQAARQVPQLLKEPLKQELSRMEKAGIIVKMEEPSDWISPLVVAR